MRNLIKANMRTMHEAKDSQHDEIMFFFDMRSFPFSDFVRLDVSPTIGFYKLHSKAIRNIRVCGS